MCASTICFVSVIFQKTNIEKITFLRWYTQHSSFIKTTRLHFWRKLEIYEAPASRCCCSPWFVWASCCTAILRSCFYFTHFFQLWKVAYSSDHSLERLISGCPSEGVSSAVDPVTQGAHWRPFVQLSLIFNQVSTQFFLSWNTVNHNHLHICNTSKWFMSFFYIEL